MVGPGEVDEELEPEVKEECEGKYGEINMVSFQYYISGIKFTHSFSNMTLALKGINLSCSGCGEEKGKKKGMERNFGFIKFFN